MDNQEHIYLLKQGVETWNMWRSKQDWRTRPNLRDANLAGADLKGANLAEADLNGADLSRANLRQANLAGADLNGADLRGADLSISDLSDANLSDADLSGADLGLTNLSDANLRDADLRGAIVVDTIFINVDLRKTKGLIEINYQGPSPVTLYTVLLPQDGSALHFLRETGVPDEWIDDYLAHMIHPIQYHSLFISYSSKDDLLATRLHADFQAKGVRCWFAPHDLKPGNYVRKEIDKAIHMQDKLLLILSKDAVSSGWVSYEVELALSREICQQREILFPIRLDNGVLQSTSDWATTLQATRHIGDFTNWTDPQIYQLVFDRLLRDLKKTDA